MFSFNPGPIYRSTDARPRINIATDSKTAGAVGGREVLSGLLLNIGASPCQADARGRTPLHACVVVALRQSPRVGRDANNDASLGEQQPVMETIADLPRRGGSLDTQDEDGNTPLDYTLELTALRGYDARRWPLMQETPTKVVRFTLAGAAQLEMSPSGAVKARLVHARDGPTGGREAWAASVPRHRDNESDGGHEMDLIATRCGEKLPRLGNLPVNKCNAMTCFEQP